MAGEARLERHALRRRGSTPAGGDRPRVAASYRRGSGADRRYGPAAVARSGGSPAIARLRTDAPPAPPLVIMALGEAQRHDHDAGRTRTPLSRVKRERLVLRLLR